MGTGWRKKGEGREGTGQAEQSFMGHRGNLGFDLREVGALEGLGTRGDLTQVLMGALW